MTPNGKAERYRQDPTRGTISQVSFIGLRCHSNGVTHGGPKLEDTLHLTARDLKYSSSTIQADLDRFQRQKVANLREMATNMARGHRDWCKKNLEAWQAAKKEIDNIPEHPNSTPSMQRAPPSPPNLRRDSGATINGP